jgi:hypothetical protein
MITTSYGLGDWGRILSPSSAKRLPLGPIQPPQWMLECGVHHSPPTSALVKKTCIYTPWLHSAQLVKHRENFTLVLSLFSLPSTSFLIHISLSYHSALFVYWCCQGNEWLTEKHGKPQSQQSVFQPRFEQSAEHKSSLSQLAWWLYMYCLSY